MTEPIDLSAPTTLVRCHCGRNHVVPTRVVIEMPKVKPWRFKAGQPPNREEILTTERMSDE